MKNSYVDTAVDAMAALLAVVLFAFFGLVLIFALVPSELITVLRQL